MPSSSFTTRPCPRVYGYLLSRCGAAALAEDLTAETFLAAVDAAGRDDPPAMTVPWIVGVARHKLARSGAPCSRASPSTTSKGPWIASGRRWPAGAPAPATTADGHGDLGYITMEVVVDSVRARSFHGSVLGWRFRPGHAEGGWDVEDVAPMVGMIGGASTATIVPMYQVDDLAIAVERVRATGGTATDPERQPYGVTSACTDDQGTRFHLGQL